jgi:hypothetical protein
MGRVPDEQTMTVEQAIEISESEILIHAQFFIHKDYSISHKDILTDVLAKHYCGQQLRIRLYDGENFWFSGFETFILDLCRQFNICTDQIIVETHNPDAQAYPTEPMKLGIFLSVKSYLPSTINKDLSDARFIGCLLGRFNINRLVLAYELDQSFPGDTFITYQPRKDFVADSLKHFSGLYQQELEWVANKTFDQDLLSKHWMGMIDWYDSCRCYGNVWNKYQIEVISETDAVSNFWFTEKTANCLATGKPFVLVAGHGSLERLQKMGFRTFGSVIDESYDCAITPRERIKHLTHSLKQLYNSACREQQMAELYAIANQNIELYNNYTKYN